MEFKKTALITGTSQGIGLQLMKSFCENGYNVIATEIDARYEKLLEICERIMKDNNFDIRAVRLDLLDISHIRSCICKLQEEHVNIDVLVNNAGTNIYRNCMEITEEEWDYVVDLNLKGTFFITQQVIRTMLPRQSGSIIIIASQHGVVGNELRAPYCASKGGVINLTRALSYELAPYNIRVNSISPTFVLTEKNRSLLNEAKFRRKNLNRIPLGRYALPEDVAEAALFLAGEKANMITGHNIMLDGGWTAI